MIFFFSIILDSDSTSIVQKVSLRNDDLNLGEQTMAQVCTTRVISLRTTSVFISISMMKWNETYQ